MEVTDVSQLMSLIEAGTVSIVCDPTQLEGSSGDIDDNVLASEAAANPASILNQSLAGSLAVREDDGKESNDTFSPSCSADGMEVNEFSSLGEAVGTEKLAEYEADKSAQLQLSAEHYIIQTVDGEFIQVLGMLEENAEDNTLHETSLVQGVMEASASEHMNGNSDGVQILMVGNNSEESVYLFSTPDEVEESGDTQSSQPLEVKNNTLLEDSEAACLLKPSSTITLPISAGLKAPLVKVEESICEDDLLPDTLAIEDPKFSIRQPACKDTDKFDSFPEESQLSKDLLDNVTFLKNCHQKTQRDKEMPPFKTLASKFLTEGDLVKTDRGDMVAYNLSSLPQQKESNGQVSRLQNIASLFGPAMKVLRPVEPKKELPPKTICKKYSVFNCSECSAVLHSERSLQNHQRKYHKEWEEECFICGSKFLNVQYVRSHIQEVHSGQESFQCRLCPYKCESVKDLLRHHKSHRESRTCKYCGRKYITLKLYLKHVVRCRERKKSQVPQANHNSASTIHNIPEMEQTQIKALSCDKDKDCTKIEPKNYEDATECDDTSLNTPLDSTHGKRKHAKTSSTQKVVRNDDEFRFESKHYLKQAKKIAQEQVNVPVMRSRRAGRERTHRCYLCFKLFLTAEALETHKENYHQAKSERPVRVKTDTALDEWEEPAENVVAPKVIHHCETTEEVLVKEEPVELSEDFDNLTIIIDESVNSRVLKPLCIACKAYTNVDFRKHSKWLCQIPDDIQSDTLKRFQQFFPCTFDPAALAEPWVMCKKCANLIDKIVDMEEKLSSMKSDLFSRVKGSNEADSDVNENDISLEKDMREISQMETLNSIMDGNAKCLGKNLSDVEAYMKDTCEIMEIIKPQKKPGRPRKHMKEKLTPVLVEEKDEGESSADVVELFNHSSGKNEQESTDVKIDTTSNSDTKIEAQLSEKNGILSDSTFDHGKLKQEPMQYEFDSDRSISDSVSWDEISLTDQRNQFHIAAIEPEKRDHLDSNTFTPEMILKNLEGACENESQSEVLEVKRTDFIDSHNSKSESYCETFPLESTTISSNRKTEDLDALDDERCDTPETLNSKDIYERENALQSDFDDYGYEARETSTSTEEQPDELSSSLLFSVDKKPDTQVSDVPLSKLGKKKARIQEKRSKMCYKVDELSFKPWRCKECDKSFSTERGACDHYAASHKGEKYACEHCSVSYVRKRDLIGHYNRMHLNIKPYKCKLSECPQTFSSHGQLYCHMQSAHNLKKSGSRHDCHMCGATFSEKRYRDTHLLICRSKGSDSVPHRCLLCHKTFKLAKYLYLHIRTVHYKDEMFFCEICNKVLTDKKNLIIHMKSHMGETKVKCKVCGREFNRKSYLWTHMRTHTDHRPYKCKYCEKSFCQYSTRKNHERTHTGEKPYKCMTCSANFATSSSLSKHMQYSHYNIRSFECEICKKKFISKAKISEHMVVHTGEKPYKCHVCLRAFNKKNNLRTHMYVHSANKKYKCELCGEGFMRRSTIESHILERHKLDIVMSSNTTPGKDGDMAISTSQFISMKGADDVPPEASYIVVYADEDEDLSDAKEMQVTVLAEEGTANQIGITGRQAATATDCNKTITKMDSSADVLPEVILQDSSGRNSDALTTLISNDISSAITIAEGSDAGVSQVMEIDEASFKLVTSEDATASAYS